MQQANNPNWWDIYSGGWSEFLGNQGYGGGGDASSGTPTYTVTGTGYSDLPPQIDWTWLFNPYGGGAPGSPGYQEPIGVGGGIANPSPQPMPSPPQNPPAESVMPPMSEADLGQILGLEPQIPGEQAPAVTTNWPNPDYDPSTGLPWGVLIPGAVAGALIPTYSTTATAPMPTEPTAPDTLPPTPEIPPFVPDTGIPTFDVTATAPPLSDPSTAGTIWNPTSPPAEPGTPPPITQGPELIPKFPPPDTTMPIPLTPVPVPVPIPGGTTPKPPVPMPQIPISAGGGGAPGPGLMAPVVGAQPTKSVFEGAYQPAKMPSLGEILASVLGGQNAR